MLHAALIGFPSTGKSTLFQLMTSAKDAPKGKGDTVIGISKVPDVRLDKLTAIFNPKKRVPATIEFTDIIAQGAAAPPRSSMSPATRMPTRSSTWCARFAIPRCRIPPARSIPARDAQAMEDELILADLGVVERRLERMEKDLKKNKSPELDKEKNCCSSARSALENGQPLRALGLAGEDVRRLRGFQLLSPSRCSVVINLDESDVDAAASVENGRRSAPA
jgi:ribosome-binding ATPase YchF (GTP1/OBG family)